MKTIRHKNLFLYLKEFFQLQQILGIWFSTALWEVEQHKQLQ